MNNIHSVSTKNIPKISEEPVNERRLLKLTMTTAGYDSRRWLENHKATRAKNRHRVGFRDLKLAEFTDIGRSLGMGGVEEEEEMKRRAQQELLNREKERKARREQAARQDMLSKAMTSRSRAVELPEEEYKASNDAPSGRPVLRRLDSRDRAFTTYDDHGNVSFASLDGSRSALDSKNSRDRAVTSVSQFYHETKEHDDAPATRNALRRYSFGRNGSIPALASLLTSIQIAKTEESATVPVKFSVEDQGEKVLSKALSSQADLIEQEVKRIFMSYAMKVNHSMGSDEIEGAKFVQLLRDKGILILRPDVFDIRHADLIYVKAQGKDPQKKVHYNIFRQFALPMIADQMALKEMRLLEIISGISMPDFSDLVQTPSNSTNSRRSATKEGLQGNAGAEDQVPSLTFSAFEYLRKKRRNSLREQGIKQRNTFSPNTTLRKAPSFKTQSDLDTSGSVRGQQTFDGVPVHIVRVHSLLSPQTSIGNFQEAQNSFISQQNSVRNFFEASPQKAAPPSSRKKVNETKNS